MKDIEQEKPKKSSSKSSSQESDAQSLLGCKQRLGNILQQRCKILAIRVLTGAEKCDKNKNSY